MYLLFVGLHYTLTLLTPFYSTVDIIKLNQERRKLRSEVPVILGRRSQFSFDAIALST